MNSQGPLNLAVPPCTIIQKNPALQRDVRELPYS